MSVRVVLRSLLALSLFAILSVGSRAGIDAETDLEKRDSSGELRRLRTELFKGTQQTKLDEKTHIDAIDLRAKQVTFKFTWARFVVGDDKSHGIPPVGAINAAFEEFESDLNQLNKSRGSNGTATQFFCRKVTEHAKEVIDANPPEVRASRAISAVNAARVLARLVEHSPTLTYEAWTQEVLPRMAEGNAEFLANVWLEQIRADKGYNEAVKYLAWKGLHDLLSLPPQTPALLKKDTEEAIYREAVKGIEKKVPFAAGTPKEEVYGYQVLRREMIRTLATCRQPVIDNKARPAVTLLRVAGADLGLSPKPREDERVEAAIGLARLRPEKMPDYQSDYAIEKIAETVNQFIIDFNADTKGNSVGKHSRHWKVDAARLAEAIEGMKVDAKSKYLLAAADRCLEPLALLEAAKSAESASLTEWLRTNPSPVKELLRGDATTAVKSAEKSE
jgi:hypothetical protein